MLKDATAQERKNHPVYSGFIRYFPKAMAEVARLSKIGNDQHNPGKPLHWDRSKSGDELDALSRHLTQAGTRDTDGVWHDTKVAWRAMANLEKLLEEQEAAITETQRPNPLNYDALLWAGTPFTPPLDPYYDHYAGPTEAKEIEGEIVPADSETASGDDATPESEDDTYLETDATGQPNEIEPHSDEDHDPPAAPEYGVVMVRKTSNDRPSWQPLSSLAKHKPFV